jgi:hypothetical protein
MWRARDVMTNATAKTLVGYLRSPEPPIDTDGDRKLFRMAKTAFDACMDTDAIKAAGFQPVAKILHSVSEMFPVEDEAYRTLNHTPPQLSDAPYFRDTHLYLAKTWEFSATISVSPLYTEEDPVRSS